MQRIVVVGSLNIDLVVSAPRLPVAGETLPGGDLMTHEGGKGGNHACAAGRLGGHVTMVGQVGPDPFGARLSESLHAANVDVSGVAVSERPTGSAVICVLSSGENAIIVSSGANATLSAKMAVERLRTASPYGLLLGQLETPMTTVVAAFAEAKRCGATTILDPAPAQPLPCELVELVDFITPNQVEAASLLGKEQPVRTMREAQSDAEALLLRGFRGVILKLGALGCYLATGSFRATVPAFEMPVVDSTAAGDTFNGAFAVSLAEGASLDESARFANAAAALSVGRSGAQNSIPYRSEVDQFLRRYAAVNCPR